MSTMMDIGVRSGSTSISKPLNNQRARTEPKPTNWSKQIESNRIELDRDSLVHFRLCFCFRHHWILWKISNPSMQKVAQSQFVWGHSKRSEFARNGSEITVNAFEASLHRLKNIVIELPRLRTNNKQANCSLLYSYIRYYSKFRSSSSQVAALVMFNWDANYTPL